VNVGGGAPPGGWGGQYFVGDFDGSTFTDDNASAPAQSLPDGVLLADFEGGSYGAWTKTGSAFGNAPAPGTLASQNPVSGFLGSGLVDSYLNGDGSTGVLTSPSFKVTRRYLNFLIGGGNLAGQTCINLKVNGQIVRTATGEDDEFLNWKNWDVTEFAGSDAVLEIVDAATGGWGHINIDHILMADTLFRPIPAR